MFHAHTVLRGLRSATLRDALFLAGLLGPLVPDRPHWPSAPRLGPVPVAVIVALVLPVSASRVFARTWRRGLRLLALVVLPAFLRPLGTAVTPGFGAGRSLGEIVNRARPTRPRVVARTHAALPRGFVATRDGTETQILGCICHSPPSIPH